MIPVMQSHNKLCPKVSCITLPGGYPHIWDSWPM